jgi:xylulokinase
MTRAVLEGVAFGLRDSFELMRNAGLGSVEQVRITGGGAKSPIWRQILADIFGVDLVTVSSEEGAAYGAALLAAVGDGVWPDVPSACSQVIQITGSTSPESDQIPVYNRQYANYRNLYPTLKESFHQLST